MTYIGDSATHRFMYNDVINLNKETIRTFAHVVQLNLWREIYAKEKFEHEDLGVPY